jgi:hypothetical protein
MELEKNDESFPVDVLVRLVRQTTTSLAPNSSLCHVKRLTKVCAVALWNVLLAYSPRWAISWSRREQGTFTMEGIYFTCISTMRARQDVTKQVCYAIKLLTWILVKISARTQITLTEDYRYSPHGLQSGHDGFRLFFRSLWF